jgi:hypothetical protein
MRDRYYETADALLNKTRNIDLTTLPHIPEIAS